MLIDNSVASCHWWRAWGGGGGEKGDGVEPTLICGQKQNGEKRREDGGGGEEGKNKRRDGGKRGRGQKMAGRGNNGTTSDSHWNITTQRETSIRKNGLI